jgi:hypothetical protein
MDDPRVALTLSPAERVWLANQERKWLGSRSKYVPHQNVGERARRLRQVAALEEKRARRAG